MIIGQLNDSINIDFPLDKQKIIVTDDSFILKTKVLETLNSFLINEGANTIYFPSDRMMNVSKDEIETIDISFKLAKGMTLRENIENAYNIKDPFKFEEIYKGKEIDCGYLQVLNFFYTIHSNPNKNLNIIIDNLHCNLHYLIQEKLVFDLMTCYANKIDRFIFSVYNTDPFKRICHKDNFKVINVNEILKRS